MADLEAPRPRRGRRVAWWVGLGLVAAGLGVLGFVAWQFWGTTYVSHRAQRQLAGRLQQAWRTDPGQRLEPQHVPLGGASALIRIPRFGASYAVPVLEGVGQRELAQGFGHFTQTADPGRRGNYALAGHRVTHGQPLRDMPDLRPGDRVIVETVRATYTYVLDTDPSDLVVDLTAGWVLAPVPHNPHPGVEPDQEPGQRLITLTTCAELFHTSNRMVAFGHLVKTVPRG